MRGQPCAEVARTRAEELGDRPEEAGPHVRPPDHGPVAGLFAGVLPVKRIRATIRFHTEQKSDALLPGRITFAFAGRAQRGGGGAGGGCAMTAGALIARVTFGLSVGASARHA